MAQVPEKFNLYWAGKKLLASTTNFFHHFGSVHES